MQKPKSLPAAVLVALLAGGSPALADQCLDEVRSAYAEHLAPYERRPYRSVRVRTDEAGATIARFQNVVQTPSRTISLVEGSVATLAVDGDSWTGPGLDGPWTPSPNAFPDDRRAVHERQHAEQVENLGDARCGGMVEVEGRQLLHYGFTTRTNPDEAQNGMWFGATSDVYLDPETMEVVRWEMTDFTSSFAPGAMKQKSVEDFDYDDGIVVDPPD